MNGRYLIVFNPNAGKGKAFRHLPELRERLDKAGLLYTITMTEGGGHAIELAREAVVLGYEGVIAAGGDGTANEVVNGLMGARAKGVKPIIMGHLPIGRGNDFAFGAHVPADFGKALDCVIARRSRPMDVGFIRGGDYPEGRYFCNGVGIGFDTLVGLTAARMRFAKGGWAYGLAALREFVVMQPAPDMVIEIDGERLETASRQINVMNGPRLGGIFFMAPDAVNHDGHFNYCFTLPMGRREMAKVLWRYTKGTQASHPSMRSGSVKRFNVTSDGGLVVHADGETICVDGSEIEITCVASAIDMICDVSGA